MRAKSALFLLPFLACAAEPDARPALGEGEVRAAWFETDITPPVGAHVAGYDIHTVSVCKYDGLKASGLCIDDGSNRVLLVSLDLEGLDSAAIRRMRTRLGAIVGAAEAAVLVSCTHNHEGPPTSMYSRENFIPDEWVKDDSAFGIGDYMRFLNARLEKAATEMARGPWRTCRIGFTSTTVDENRNRRYTTGENRASFNAHRPILHEITREIADKELGTVLLTEKGEPVYVIGNYAAHPLSAHAPGRGGRRLGPDFPGFYRRYVEEETGAKAMFVQGAAGDLVGKDEELGLEAARRTGVNLAMASLKSVITIQRCQERFFLPKPRVGGEIRSFTSRLRKQWRDHYGRDEQTFEVQVVAIGDVAFVGVPGELVNELGLEIKWNSPFARTYIAYIGTGYAGYLVPTHLMAAGGYEPYSQRFASRDTLKLVGTATDAAFALRSRLFPEDDVGDDPYPDNRFSPVVNVPAMQKGTKWDK